MSKVAIVRKSAKGFTLIELMVAIAIAAILLAVAAPSFRETIIRSNLDTLQDAFAAAVLTARTESLNRATIVRICPLDAMVDNATQDCVGGDWSLGWVVIAFDRSAQPVPQSAIISRFQNSAGYPLDVRRENNAVNSMAFDSQGYMLDLARHVFGVCERVDDPQHRRGVAVEPTGRTLFLYGGARNQTTVNFHNSGADGAEDNVNQLNIECV